MPNRLEGFSRSAGGHLFPNKESGSFVKGFPVLGRLSRGPAQNLTEILGNRAPGEGAEKKPEEVGGVGNPNVECGTLRPFFSFLPAWPELQLGSLMQAKWF